MIDFFIILIIGYAFYKGYKTGISKQLYELVKIFAGITFANKYGVSIGLFLIKKQILFPENFASLKLIGFLLLFMFFWGAMMIIENVYSTFIKNKFKALNKILGSLANGTQIFFILMISLFIVSQFRFNNARIKYFFYSYSKIYPYMHSFCKDIITKKFVNSVISGNSFNIKEILINTIENKIAK